MMETGIWVKDRFQQKESRAGCLRKAGSEHGFHVLHGSGGSGSNMMLKFIFLHYKSPKTSSILPSSYHTTLLLPAFY